MIYSVKILRPNQDGKLIEIGQIPSLEASKIHWSNFNNDLHRSNMKGNTGVKYHRIGVSLKQCVEKTCEIIITDPRRKTCSTKCRNKRIERQRQLSKDKKRAKYQELKLMKNSI